MSTLIRKKDGSYQAIISYKSNGKWKQKSKQGFKRKKDAKLWLEKNNLLFLEYDSKKEYVYITINEALVLYLKHKKENVKFTTYKNIKSQVKILKLLGDIRVIDIKPIDISDFFIKIKEDNNRLYNSLIITIKNFFYFCIKQLKIIKENPVVDIKRKKSIDKRVKYIDFKMYESILSILTDEKHKLFVKILYNTGMRKSEVFGLKYEDIEKNIITVSRQKIHGQITGLKTQNSYRKIPIKKDLYNEILSIKDDSEYIFDKNININYPLKKFNTSAHCFRHTYATNLISKGINMKVASEILGDTLDIFIKTYIQTSSIEKEIAFERLINDN